LRIGLILPGTVVGKTALAHLVNPPLS
jgi:hypothetical protein